MTHRYFPQHSPLLKQLLQLEPEPVYAATPSAWVWGVVAALLIGLGTGMQLMPWHNALMLQLNLAASVLPAELWAWLTVSGTGWAVLILVSVSSRQEHGARLVLTAFVLGTLVIQLLKPWLGVLRPGDVLPLEMLHIIGRPVRYSFSMPSGHALAAMCLGSLWVCVIRSHQYPKWLEWMAWIFVTWIAMSRVAVGAHWPSDVLVGAGLGLIVGWLAWRLPCAWPRQTPHAFPWVAIGVEGLGAVAAFTVHEHMEPGLWWQYTLGCVALASITWRIWAWRITLT